MTPGLKPNGHGLMIVKPETPDFTQNLNSAVPQSALIRQSSKFKKQPAAPKSSSQMVGAHLTPYEQLKQSMNEKRTSAKFV